MTQSYLQQYILHHQSVGGNKHSQPCFRYKFFPIQYFHLKKVLEELVEVHINILKHLQQKAYKDWKVD